MGKVKSCNKATPKIVGMLITLAIVASGVYAFLLKPGSQSKAPAEQVMDDGELSSGGADASVQDVIEMPMSMNICKDGTYIANVAYDVPKSSNGLEVEVILSGDVLTSVSATHKLDSGDSKSTVYLNNFDAALSGQVVGRKIEDINLSRVGGASLTTDAFNAALSDVMQQAKL
ncbi:MAG: hypothetical protein PVI21_03590 [Candidatus Woesebacteria bacterium]|jgi:hypothetical protein